MDLRTAATYVRELRPALPASAFEPGRSRVLWLPLHVAVIASIVWALASRALPGPLWPVASIVIGCSMGGITFLAHETLHGGIVRGKWAIRIVGWLGFLPFTVSPQLWVAWHNRVHHNHCAQVGIDPDMYPTLDEYRTQKNARIMANFSLGRRRLLGLLSLFVGFTGQSGHMLFVAGKRGYLTPALHRRAIAETLLGVAFWAALGFVVGPVVFVFAYFLPLLVANAVVMGFILTNHNLSPITTVNDPLVNSLTVTLSRPFEWVTLGFGYHVEHHLFPTMSMRHGATVRKAVMARFPDRYQSMPMWQALWQLHSTARVYQDETTLIDPPSGLTWPTLQPRDAA